ncbi:vascular cell adhesion protein 1-like isoform X2 [Mobula hypostoma]|uniref:vascular cell adhesion protein 1-like isoform X2 n=1 Tax=Mobula hypostoma TaxID=723540 RepID=UPI002FC27577
MYSRSIFLFALLLVVTDRNLSIVLHPDVLEVNKPYQLECFGPKVYPKNKLVLTWLRGSEVVQRNSTEEQGFPDDGPLKNIFHFTPSISDNGLVYTCLAELKLSDNSTKWIANASVTLQMYYKPQNTVISVNNKPTSELVIFIRKGDEAVVTCRSNGNPAVTIKWRYPHQGSKNETYPSGVLSISEMTSAHGGIYTCIATNLLGSDSKTVIISIRGVKGEEWMIALIIIEVAFVLCVILAVICCWMLCYLSKSGSYVTQENPSELN